MTSASHQLQHTWHMHDLMCCGVLTVPRHPIERFQMRHLVLAWLFRDLHPKKLNCQAIIRIVLLHHTHATHLVNDPALRCSHPCMPRDLCRQLLSHCQQPVLTELEDADAVIAGSCWHQTAIRVTAVWWATPTGASSGGRGEWGWGAGSRRMWG